MSAGSWSKVAVGDLLTRPLRNGISPSSKGTVTGDVLTLSAVTGPRFDASARKTAQFESAHDPDKTVRSADLLICRGNGNIGLVGRARRPDIDLPDVAFPDTMIGASFDPGRVDPTFLEYLWDSSIVRGQIEELARSTNGTHKINQGMVERLEIPLPPLWEQRRIADVLDAVDGLRAKRREALAKLDTLTQAVFFDMFGDPVTNPRGWPATRTLDDVAEVRSGITKGRKTRDVQLTEVPYLAVANVHDGYLKLDGIKTIAASDAELDRYALQEGDVVLTEGGDPDKLGRGTVWRGELHPCIHQNHVFRVRLKDENLTPEYVSLLIGSQRGKRYFLRMAKQTTGIASINMTQLRGFPLLEPPLELQRQFLERAARIGELSLEALRSARHLEDMFASLKQRAFRGELP